MNYIQNYISPIGEMFMFSDGENLINLSYVNAKYYQELHKSNAIKNNLPIFETTKSWLDIYFNGGIPNFTPSIKLKGTDFRMKVWKLLMDIPYGTTTTYGEIAKKISSQNNLKQMSAQAVGGAIGHNPISIIIPCHRVIGSDGCMTGYAGGIDKKVKLLKIEGAYKDNFSLPKI